MNGRRAREPATLSRVVGAAALLLAAFLLGNDGRLLAGAQAGVPQVRILEPPPTRAVAGPTRFAVEVEPAPGRRIVEVRLYVDGHRVAVLRKPPWETIFDAGTRLGAHTLRVEAQDDAGAVGADLGTTLYVSFVERITVIGDWVPRRAVQVGVVDRRGEPVLDLAAGEFMLRSDGRRQLLLEAARDTRPLAVELLLDLSGSTAPYLPQIRDAANRFLSLLHEEDGSEISVFAGSVYRVAPFGHDHVASRQAVLAFQPLEEPLRFQPVGSLLYDALAQAIEAINMRPGQRSIAVFTDSLDTGSRLSFPQVADVIHRASIRIDFIRFGRKPVGAYSRSTLLIRRMRRLAEESGGREWRIRDVDDIVPTFELLARQLKGRYRLVFAPEIEKGRKERLHPLRIRVDRGGARVLAPAGFVD
jgi:VWFA-related protein